MIGIGFLIVLMFVNFSVILWIDGRCFMIVLVLMCDRLSSM